MFYRKLFVTNSSSTSLIAYGVSMDRDKFWELEEKAGLPKGIDYRSTPWDTTYVYFYLPDLGIDSEGLLEFPERDAVQQKHAALKKWLTDVGFTEDEMGHIEDSWYNG